LEYTGDVRVGLTFCVLCQLDTDPPAGGRITEGGPASVPQEGECIMATVSPVMLKSAEWLMDTLLTIVKQIRDGKYTEDYLKSSVKPVLQAIREGREFTPMKFPGTNDETSLEKERKREERQFERLCDHNGAKQLVEWREFYRDEFNLECDFSSLFVPVVPEHKQGFSRLIVAAQGLTPEQVFQHCAKYFPHSPYTNLGHPPRITDKRTSRRKPYAVWVRDRAETDRELINRSANDLKRQKVLGITLLECLLLVLKRFREDEEPLKGTTLCSGSRTSTGDVPIIGCYPSPGSDSFGLKINPWSPDRFDPDIGTREVIA